jgi:hypothetical protein
MTRDTGETDLTRLLGELNPVLLPGDYVFASLRRWRWQELEPLAPLAIFREEEGLSVVLERDTAAAAGLDVDAPFRGITLSPHSSLQAVGLTAAVAAALAERGIPANVIAGYYHDHIFVPAQRSGEALRVLAALAA